MQNPPPGPPPGGPPNYPPPGGPPSYPPPGGQPPGYPPMASGGVDKRTGAILSYLFWWVTGIIFLFVGKDDPDVKFHAAQSTVFFGSITVVYLLLNIVGRFSFFLGFILGLVSFVVVLFGVIVWIMCLMRASSGGGARFEIPWVGGFVTPYAEQLANAV